MKKDLSGFVGNFRKFGAGRLMIMAGALLLAKSGTASATVIQEPIGVSGFDGDTIVDAAASVTSGTHTANASSSSVYTSSTNVLVSAMSGPGYSHNAGTFYQDGWNDPSTVAGGGTGNAPSAASDGGTPTGLPAGGSFTSAITNVAGSNTVFDFGYNGTATDYADNNCLYFTASGSATLNLVAPAQAATLDFLAAAELPTATSRTQFDVTLHFTNLTSDTYTQAITTGPLGDNGVKPLPANIALSGLYGTDDGNSNKDNNAFGTAKTFGGGSAYMTESDITLTPADQALTISSITFTTDSLIGSTAAIYAVSGQVYVPEPATLGVLTLALPLLARRRRRSI